MSPADAGLPGPLDHVTAVLSMLHEPAARDASPANPLAADNSATRAFRGKPVLAWTLERLRRSARIESMAVLCWGDQFARVEPIAERYGAYVLAKGPRGAAPALEAVAACRRWADGWRGGLLGTCEFDRGYHAPYVVEIADALSADAVVVVDPSAGLVDAGLIDALIAHAARHGEPELTFSPAAPGLSGVLMRTGLLGRLAGADTHPGKFLHYLPDEPCRDPLAGDGCCPPAAALARTTHRFTLDSRRQILRLGRATADVNGRLLSTPAEGLLSALDHDAGPDPLPREIVLELTPRRHSRPIFSPARHLAAALARPDFSAAQARALFAELAGWDDLRLTLAGVGDPLLAPDCLPILRLAREAGIPAVRLETDLLGQDDAALAALAAAPLDIISVHLPALSPATYAAVMGVEGLPGAVRAVGQLLRRRETRRSGTPVVAALFTKCRDNLAEMEGWYDHWLRALGAAVIAGPGDYAGQIPDAAVADMAPPPRRPCRRLESRLTILSDGTIVACEQDVLGRHPLGRLGQTPLAEAWSERLAPLRSDHAACRWKERPLCAACREWHRP